MPCHRAAVPFSCGRKCGRDLKCTRHTCQLDCHYIPENERGTNQVSRKKIWFFKVLRIKFQLSFNHRHRLNAKNAREFASCRGQKDAITSARSEHVIQARVQSVCIWKKWNVIANPTLSTSNVTSGIREVLASETSCSHVKCLVPKMYKSLIFCDWIDDYFLPKWQVFNFKTDCIFFKLSCGHTCTLKCHPGKCSSPSDCTTKVSVKCQCKKLKKTFACNLIKANNEELIKINDKFYLKCNQKCAVADEKSSVEEASNDTQKANSIANETNNTRTPIFFILALVVLVISLGIFFLFSPKTNWIYFCSLSFHIFSYI